MVFTVSSRKGGQGLLSDSPLGAEGNRGCVIWRLYAIPVGAKDRLSLYPMCADIS